jgi:outer membrane lipoprotein carrier protein
MVLAFLKGRPRLERHFKIRRIRHARLRAAKIYVLEATPYEAAPTLQKMVLSIDAESYRVKRVLILDAHGNRNRFAFSDVKLGASVPRGTFSTRTPPGTRVVRPGKK